MDGLGSARLRYADAGWACVPLGSCWRLLELADLIVNHRLWLRSSCRSLLRRRRHLGMLVMLLELEGVVVVLWDVLMENGDAWNLVSDDLDG